VTVRNYCRAACDISEVRRSSTRDQLSQRKGVIPLLEYSLIVCSYGTVWFIIYNTDVIERKSGERSLKNLALTGFQHVTYCHPHKCSNKCFLQHLCYYPHMPTGKVIQRSCNYVCAFVRLWISPPRIKAALNFTQRFIGVQGRDSAILGNFAPQKPKIGRIGQSVKDDECSNW